MRNINLLPPELAERRRARRQAVLLVIIGVSYVALLAAFWLVRNLEVGRQRERLEVAQRSAATLQVQVDGLREFADLERLVKERQATLATVMDRDVAWSRLLIELSMIIPGDSWLTTFAGTAEVSDQQAAATQPTPLAPARLGTLSFAGNTFDFPGVAKWITRLQELKSLQTIWVPSAAKTQIQGREVINFTSTADLSTGAASNRYKAATP